MDESWVSIELTLNREYKQQVNSRNVESQNISLCLLLNVAFRPLHVTVFAKRRIKQTESFYVKFQLVPLRTTSSGLHLLHNRKKTTKHCAMAQKLWHERQFYSSVKPIRFYENELQDTKQMFPFSL
jgi:hypothetical protein